MRVSPTLAANRGFSLIELLAAATILGILASIAVPVVETTVRREKERELRQSLRDIRRGIDAYRQAVAAQSITIKSDQSGYPPKLESLTMGISNEQDLTGPKLVFLRRIPRDPFFADHTVAASETWGKREYTSPEEAPREGDDVFDVYSKSGLTGLNGVPYADW